MTPEEIEYLTELWAAITDRLDFHAKVWREHVDDEWREISFQRVHDVLYELGVGEETQFEDGQAIPDEERSKIIQEMIHRDGEAHARPYADVKRAQLRLGL